MSNWTYFCLFAINICKTYPFDICVRVAHTLFSAKCLPSLLGSCNYLFGRRSSQAFRDFINFQQLIPNFCWCCCLYLVISLGERSNANLGNYRKIWIAWHLARKWLWWRNRWQSEHSPFFMVNSMFTAWLSRDKEVILPGLCHFQATCPWRNCLSILCLTLLICWDNNSVYFVDLWELKNLKCVQSKLCVYYHMHWINGNCNCGYNYQHEER